MTYVTSFGKTFDSYEDYIKELVDREQNNPVCYEYYPNRAKHKAEWAKLEDNSAPDFGYDVKE